jgi:hypothetical protein
LKITESIHYLIFKNLDTLGHSLNTPAIFEVLNIHNIEDIAKCLKSCICEQTSDKNTFDILQYLVTCMHSDFDSYDIRHRATALMCHMYDHCWNSEGDTEGVLGTDVMDFFVLQSYLLAINDEEYIEEWLIIVNILVEYIQSIDYKPHLDHHPSAFFTNSLRVNFSILEFPKTDCSEYNFEYWGGFTCVNETEKARLTVFFEEYYPGLERGLYIL